ncbi:MAG: 50S ribosomal protein L25 [Acidobacteria bacterium]|nr:50S ribosomal protein L25 [Acidobacteriota bacterium]MBI3426295.1 50S ribosomal protein L25 [Acidobacteriota bacterium]
MSFDSELSLTAQARTERGKNAARRLRAKGEIPLTVYGGGDPASGTVNKRELGAFLRANGRNKIFNLNLDGAATAVKISEMQLDPIKGVLIHLDLMRISMTEKSEFELPIRIVGESEGVKLFGGILDFPTHSIRVRCLPGDLPDTIEVDVSKLGLGGHIEVRDLRLGDAVEIRTRPEQTLVTCVAPGAAEEAPAEAAAVAEPEVIKKGKGDEKEKK